MVASITLDEDLVARLQDIAEVLGASAEGPLSIDLVLEQLLEAGIALMDSDAGDFFECSANPARAYAEVRRLILIKDHVSIGACAWLVREAARACAAARRPVRCDLAVAPLQLVGHAARLADNYGLIGDDERRDRDMVALGLGAMTADSYQGALEQFCDAATSNMPFIGQGQARLFAGIAWRALLRESPVPLAEFASVGHVPLRNVFFVALGGACARGMPALGMLELIAGVAAEPVTLSREGVSVTFTFMPEIQVVMDFARTHWSLALKGQSFFDLCALMLTESGDADRQSGDIRVIFPTSARRGLLVVRDVTLALNLDRFAALRRILVECLAHPEVRRWGHLHAWTSGAM